MMEQHLTLTVRRIALCGALAVSSLALSATMFAQTKTQPKPSPTPRRRLPKPVAGSRGFEQFAGRDASARLIAASATRNINDQGAPAYKRGQKNFAAGKYEQALQDFTEAVRLDPKSQEARYALALTLTKNAKPERAIEEFKQVLKLNPNEELKIWSYYLMGNAYADLSRYEGAIENYKEAIKLKPDLSKPHNNLGLVYAASNRIVDAFAEFNRAVQLKPDYAEAHYNLGVAYLQLGKKNEAQEQQKILLKLNQDLAVRLNALIRK